MAKASVTTDPDALREAIRVVGNLPDAVNVAAVQLEGDKFTFCRDNDGDWYLAEVE